MSDRSVVHLQNVKESNRNAVFHLIRAHRPVSRSELAKRARLSPTTVSSLVAELIGERLVREIGMGVTSTSGRKPILLDLQPGGRYLAAFDVDGHGFVSHLYDPLFDVRSEETVAVADFSALGRLLADTLARQFAALDAAPDRLLGVCIGLPALLDLEHQTVLSSTVLPPEAGVDFPDTLRSAYPGIPVLIENESTLNAYAELVFGAGRPARDLVFLDVGTGIGAGIITGGRRFTGSFGKAGEVGHMTVDLHGPECACGNRGCFEGMGGVPALQRRLAERGRVSARNGLDAVRADLDAGDPLVREAVAETAEILAAGINNLVNLVDPQVVVIGGEMARLGGPLLEGVRARLRRIGLKPGIDRLEVRFSSVPGNLVTLGGAQVVLDRAFGGPGAPLG